MQILYLDENSSDSTLDELEDKDPVALYDTCPVSFDWLESNYGQYRTVVDDEGEKLVYYVIPYAVFVALKACRDVELKDVLIV